MTPTFQLDHVVIRVNDLAVAVRDYAALGFTVTPGGEHRSLGSHNALIPFADGSYLELIAFRGPPLTEVRPIHREARARELADGGRTPLECRVVPWESAGEGFVDFAVLPIPIDAALEAARAGGITVHGPFPGGRVRPDGQQIAWQLGVADGFDLPFFCADVTPRTLRVPGGSARQHSNGATGIRRLTVAVRDLAASVARYKALLSRGAASVPGEHQVTITLGPTILALVEPTPAERWHDHLRERGEGPVRLELATGAAGGSLPMDLTHGAAIDLVPEPPPGNPHG